MADDVNMPRLIALLEVSTRKYTRAIEKAQRDTSKSLGDIEKRAANMRKKVEDEFEKLDPGKGKNFRELMGQFDKFKAAAGGLASVLAINTVRQFADEWVRAGNLIASAAEAARKSVSDVAGTLSQVADIALRSRTSFEATADLYARLTRSSADLGVSQAEVATATEIVSKAMKSAGATTAEASAAMVQLGQALASGTLQGDELRSILEGAPVLAQAIAKEFGVSIGELRKLGSEGKLTSKQVFQGIVNAAGDVERAFAKTSATTADAWQNLMTQATHYIGTSHLVTASTQATVSALDGLAKNFDAVAPGAAALGAIIASRLVSAGLTPLVAKFGQVTVSAATARGAIGLVSGAAAGSGAIATTAAFAWRSLSAAMALVGGVPGAIVLGLVAAVSYLASESGKGSEASKRYAAALEGIRPAADKAAEGIRNVGDEVALTEKRMNDAAQRRVAKGMEEDGRSAEETAKRLEQLNIQMNAYARQGVSEQEKKRAFELVQDALKGGKDEAVAALQALNDLGDANPSFAKAYTALTAFTQKLATFRTAVANAKAELATLQAKAAADAEAKKAKAEQASLFKAGVQPAGAPQDLSEDPTLRRLAVEREKNADRLEKATDKAARIQREAKAIYEDSLKTGQAFTLSEATEIATNRVEIDDANKASGRKPKKSEADKDAEALRNYIQSLREERLELEAEAAATGKSNAEKEIAISLAVRGRSANAQQAEEIRKEITLREQAKDKIKQQHEAQIELNNVTEYFGNAAIDGLLDMVENGAKADDVIKRLTSSLARAALQAALLGEGPLAGLFGTKGSDGAVGGLLGSLVKSFSGFADGGRVVGPGTGRSDSIPARLSRGEFVVNAAQTAKYLPILEAINSGHMARFADGGLVGRSGLMPDLSKLDGGPRVVINNNNGSDVGLATAPGGGLQIDINGMVETALMSSLASNGQVARTLQGMYGLRRMGGR